MAVRSTTGSWGREIYVSVPKEEVAKDPPRKNTKCSATSRNAPKGVTAEVRGNNVKHQIPC